MVGCLVDCSWLFLCGVLYLFWFAVVVLFGCLVFWVFWLAMVIACLSGCLRYFLACFDLWVLLIVLLCYVVSVGFSVALWLLF